MAERSWREIAEELNAKCGEDFEREMIALAAEMDENDLAELIEAIGELYPGKDEKDEEDEVNIIWEQYEEICYFVFLVFGDVHYADLEDEEYKEKIDELIRPLGFDELADYGMENFLSHRKK